MHLRMMNRKQMQTASLTTLLSPNAQPAPEDKLEPQVWGFSNLVTLTTWDILTNIHHFVDTSESIFVDPPTQHMKKRLQLFGLVLSLAPLSSHLRFLEFHLRMAGFNIEICR